jgi:hypothetical protein
MSEIENINLNIARKLMIEFARRTGLYEKEGGKNNRYLWTDALAVQTFFALAHIFGDQHFKDLGLKLIDQVHHTLGKFHQNDSRNGWISGLSDEEGAKRPTIGGLRIGKKLPERKPGEVYNQRQEWDMDGQYLHYLTKWFYALLQAEQETGNSQYAHWAADLLHACSNFISKENGSLRMHWKMSIDLSRPLIANMGAHDPLDTLVCLESLKEVIPEKTKPLLNLEKDLNQLCLGYDWSTSDPLGIGGLLLNTSRVLQLAPKVNQELPVAIQPDKLLEECYDSLKYYMGLKEMQRPAFQRLAFRECGLSLGIRTLAGVKAQNQENNRRIKPLDNYLILARNIEEFWIKNQDVDSWLGHLDINAVSLTSSISAQYDPAVFFKVFEGRQFEVNNN